ncbi:hypothetical protein [Ideonella sp. A 288]|uniref:hypothetical protein n=1 Tax=Ideonella sp. A 288 TaxID=1962181 RepID=UPI000B4BF766|nr:hypothetical protein [Ideonella sp. A 288]
MNPTAMVIATLIVMPALGLAAWVWFAMARVEEELRSFNGFEGMHFEIGPQAPDHSEGAT